MRVVRALLVALGLVLGLVLAVLGLGGALYVGADDTVALDTEELSDAPPGSPVVLAQDVTSFRDLDLVVEVRGPAVVGTMHPVDVTSLTDDAAHYEVTGVRRDGLLGAAREGEALRAAAVPDDLWDERVEATPDATLELDLVGDPVQVVVLPTSDDPVALGLGARLGGLFWLLLGVGLLGVLLVLLALWRGWAARRRSRRDSAAPADRDHASPGTAPGLRRSVVAATVPTLLLAGCGWTPEEVSPDGEPAKQSVPSGAGQALLDDYDRRNNAAIRRGSRPPYDDDAWQRADTGALLETDEYDTASARLDRDRDARRVTHDLVSVYPMSFTRYPMVAAMSTTSTLAREPGGGEGGRGEDEEDVEEVTVFVRESATAPWLQAASAPVEGGAPEPRPDAVPARLRPDLDGLGRVTAQVGRWLEEGEAPDLDVEGGADRAREELLRQEDEIVDRVELESYDWTRSEPASFVVPVQEGHLVLTHHSVRRVLVPVGDQTLSWNAGYDDLNGASSDGSVFTQLVTTTAVVVPDEGAARVVGLGAGPVIF